MSEPIDDKTFDEYLSRQSQLSKHYHGRFAAAGSGSPPEDEVPAALDRRILAHAHASAAGKQKRTHTRPAWMRWSAPLAVAASAILAVSIIIRSGTRHQVVSDDLAATAPQPTAASGASSPLREASPEMPRDRSDTQADGQAAAMSDSDEHPAAQVREAPQAFARKAPAASPPQPNSSPAVEPKIVAALPVAPPPRAAVSEASAPTEPATAIRTTKSESTGSDAENIAREESADQSQRFVAAARQQDAQERQRAGPRDTVVVRQVATDKQLTDAPSARLEREKDAPLWLEYIRQLRNEGRAPEADLEWRLFVAAFPQHRVDEKDTARPDVDAAAEGERAR